MSSSTESVLGNLEESVVEELAFLIFINTEVTVSVHHVLELVGSSHLSSLGHLAYHDGDGVMLFAIVGDGLERTLRRRRRDPAGIEVAVVHRLERVDDDEELLTRILLSNLVAVLKQGWDVIVLTADEAGT